MLKIDVRDVQLEDSAEIVGILNPIIEAGVYTALDTPVTLEEQRQFIRDFPERGTFLVAVTDGHVVGLQSLEPFATYTRAFDHVGVIGTYVALEHRRRGIARSLFAATFERAVGLGYEKIFTYVREDNSAALAAYLAQGFSVVGVAKRHARIGRKYVNEVFIEKFLP
jgi:L-amino acid N-acyltransferase YncA